MPTPERLFVVVVVVVVVHKITIVTITSQTEDCCRPFPIPAYLHRLLLLLIVRWLVEDTSTIRPPVGRGLRLLLLDDDDASSAIFAEKKAYFLVLPFFLFLSFPSLSLFFSTKHSNDQRVKQELSLSFFSPL